LEKKGVQDSPPPPAANSFEMVEHRPAGLLRGHVSRIVVYRETVRGHTRQRECASLAVPLVVSFGEAFAIGLGRDPTATDRIASFAAGLFAGPVIIDSFGGADCLQIDFTPLGARRYFGLPMHELADGMVPLDDVLGREGVALRERLGNAATWQERIATAERLVTERILSGPPASEAISRALGRIESSGGRVVASRLAESAGWSRKHLVMRFREEIGIGPKALARIVRFNRAMREAQSGKAGWADIAAGCGFADQAHMTREFQALAGLSPTAWQTGRH
jgi:AraC-like DNA-binding protein